MFDNKKAQVPPWVIVIAIIIAIVVIVIIYPFVDAGIKYIQSLFSMN